MGVAADCTYIQAFGRDRNRTQTNIVEQINLASELFESTFQISLGLANVIITEVRCSRYPRRTPRLLYIEGRRQYHRGCGTVPCGAKITKETSKKVGT